MYTELTPTIYPMILADLLEGELDSGVKPVGVEDKDMTFGPEGEEMVALPAVARPTLPNGFTRVVSDRKQLSFSTPALHELGTEFRQAVDFSGVHGDLVLAQRPDTAESELRRFVGELEQALGTLGPRDGFFQRIKLASAKAHIGTHFGRPNMLRSAGTEFFRATAGIREKFAGLENVLPAMALELAAEIMIGFAGSDVGKGANLDPRSSDDILETGAYECTLLTCHEMVASILLLAYADLMKKELEPGTVNDASRLLSRATWHSWASGNNDLIIAAYTALLERSRFKTREQRKPQKHDLWLRRNIDNKVRLAWAIARAPALNQNAWSDVLALMSAAEAFISTSKFELHPLAADLVRAVEVFLSGGISYKLQTPFQPRKRRA